MLHFNLLFQTNISQIDSNNELKAKQMSDFNAAIGFLF